MQSLTFSLIQGFTCEFELVQSFSYARKNFFNSMISLGVGFILLFLLKFILLLNNSIKEKKKKKKIWEAPQNEFEMWNPMASVIHNIFFLSNLL